MIAWNALPKSRLARRRKHAAAAYVVAAAALSTSALAEDAGPENALYATHCIACHGADLRGIEGLGVSLVASQFVAGSSAAELVEFVKAGRMPDDPANVSGGAMPGFGWVAEADLAAIVEFVKARNAP